MYITYAKRLFQTAVVGDIFTLRQFSVHVHTQFVHFVPWILVNDALGTITKCCYCGIIPPLFHITIFVKLTTWFQTKWILKRLLINNKYWTSLRLDTQKYFKNAPLSSKPWVISCPITTPIPAMKVQFNLYSICQQK